MKLNRISLISVLVLLSHIALSENKFDVKADMGTMTAFYRNQPVLVEWIYKTPENIQMQIPSFMKDKKISFTYKARPYPSEILFCDNITLVRFLGGWSAAKMNESIEGAAKVDLAYRGTDGKIKYRWELLPARLDPVLKMGYTKPVIVLDNIPWCFPRTASEPDNEKAAANKQPKGYGQNKQPSDMNEWTTFITDLCREMVRLYGFETVNQWGFRLGTEMNGRARWDGTVDEYNAFYIATAKAVQKVLPGARFGAYNRAGAEYEGLAKLAGLAKNENVPFDWIATSFYSVLKPKDNRSNFDALDPDVAVQSQNVPTWKAVAEASVKGNNLSREIHEYGWFLVNEYGYNDNAPGARGVAGNFYNMFTLRKAGLDKLYHWNLKDPVWENKTPLLSSLAWLFSILDYTVGSKNAELNYELKNPVQKSQKFKSVGFFNDSGKSYIMTACYNMDRNELTSNEISVYIPKKLLKKPKYKITATWYNNETDPYMQVRNDLAENGLLAQELIDKPQLIQPVNMMCPGKKGNKLVADNYATYENMMRDNLILKKYPGKIKYTDEGVVLIFKIESPMVMLISME